MAKTLEKTALWLAMTAVAVNGHVFAQGVEGPTVVESFQEAVAPAQPVFSMAQNSWSALDQPGSRVIVGESFQPLQRADVQFTDRVAAAMQGPEHRAAAQIQLRQLVAGAHQRLQPRSSRKLQPNIEQRVARLEHQVAELTAELANIRSAAVTTQAATGERPSKAGVAVGAGGSEELLTWVDRAYILPRIATTSFILVVALALRTLTDGGAIEVHLGTLLGMVYAFVLIGYGWFSYSERGAQAPVFALWGTVVMCAVVVETHRVFQALPTKLWPICCWQRPAGRRC